MMVLGIELLFRTLIWHSFLRNGIFSVEALEPIELLGRYVQSLVCFQERVFLQAGLTSCIDIALQLSQILIRLLLPWERYVAS